MLNTPYDATLEWVDFRSAERGRLACVRDNRNALRKALQNLRWSYAHPAGTLSQADQRHYVAWTRALLHDRNLLIHGR